MRAAHLVTPQIFEQRLAVNQAQAGLPERRRLDPQNAVVGDVAHESPMLVFPELPSRGVLGQAVCNQSFFGVAAMQRELDPVRGFAHET